MERFYINQPRARGNEPPMTIIDFIPFGRENAISRATLVNKCVVAGLIGETTLWKDRKMRLLLERARLDYVILNMSDGKGYYRPTKEDMQELRRYIKQEDSRAKAAFRNHSMARKLLEDFEYGRMGGE